QGISVSVGNLHVELLHQPSRSELEPVPEDGARARQGRTATRIWTRARGTDALGTGAHGTDDAGNEVPSLARRVLPGFRSREAAMSEAMTRLARGEGGERSWRKLSTDVRSAVTRQLLPATAVGCRCRRRSERRGGGFPMPGVPRHRRGGRPHTLIDDLRATSLVLPTLRR